MIWEKMTDEGSNVRLASMKQGLSVPATSGPPRATGGSRVAAGQRPVRVQRMLWSAPASSPPHHLPAPCRSRWPGGCPLGEKIAAVYSSDSELPACHVPVTWQNWPQGGCPRSTGIKAVRATVLSSRHLAPVLRPPSRRPSRDLRGALVKVAHAKQHLGA